MAYKKKAKEIPSSFEEENFDEKVNTVEEEIQNKVRVRPDGKWVKVTQAELEALEAAGTIEGYDPLTKEAKIKQEA